jgi:hypothetical protein
MIWEGFRSGAGSSYKDLTAVFTQTLLYLHFAILGPSATLAEVADGVVRDV